MAVVKMTVVGLIVLGELALAAGSLGMGVLFSQPQAAVTAVPIVETCSSPTPLTPGLPDVGRAP